jgi:hypothetical protein
MSRVPRIELLLFIATFFAFAYFHQGGGWNQNSRFAEVRAIVEEGRFAIDDFLIYRRDPAGGELRRIPMQNAEFGMDGQRHRLAWVDMVWTLYPINETPAGEGVKLEPMIELCCSGDLGYVPKTGHFHPNKPPGTSFLGVPAYFAIYHVERMLGMNPDAWWTLTLNAWMTTFASIGLVSALGCVLFFRLARALAGSALLPAALATIAFAFGTTFFPFATIFFDHAATASLLVAAMYLVREKGAAALVLAGACAGLAAITNYLAAVPVAFLAFYALTLRTEKSQSGLDVRRAVLFLAGVLPFLILICWYNAVNFGSPTRLANDFQSPLFKDTGAFLGMFHWPSPYVAALITVSPYRGVFFLCPVLIMGVYGIVVWLREKKCVAEARLCLAIFAYFFVVNAAFNGYHGGFSAGPRYLVPGIPFLALPLVVAFARFRVLTGALAILAIVNQLLLTATDAQNPLAVGGHARNDRRQDFTQNLVCDYAWPLFMYSRAWPMLDQLTEVEIEKEEKKLEDAQVDAAERERRLVALRRDLRESILRGDPSPFLLAAIEGPVSVNPIGYFEGMLEFRHYPPHSRETQWNSFNVGEFIWPQSRRSIAPLLVISGALCIWLLAAAARGDRRDADSPRDAKRVD